MRTVPLHGSIGAMDLASALRGTLAGWKRASCRAKAKGILGFLHRVEARLGIGW
jgi:hypothetical protein